MRRIAIAVMSTISGLVLLFSYHTSTGQGSISSSQDAENDSTGNESSDSDSSGTTVTGDSVNTQWGQVQVQITVQAGKIVAAEAVSYPNHSHHDVEINSYAVPILNKQAVQAQSSQIDGVSGATVTSTGYQQSLQSAIDKAHLG